MPYPAYEYDSPFFGIRWLNLTIGVWFTTLVLLVVMLVVIRRWWALGALLSGVAVLGLCFLSFGAIYHEGITEGVTGEVCWGPRALSGAPEGASSDPCYRWSQVQLTFAILSPLLYLSGLVVWRVRRRGVTAHDAADGALS